MTTRKTLLTAEDLEALPDNGRGYELVRGELREVSPANPRHGEVVVQIGYLLSNWTWQTRAGRVLAGEPGFILQRDPDTVRAPDVAFMSRARRRPRDQVRGYREGAPDLVVEVISPGDRAGEVEEKTRAWLAAGARVVWNVYPEREMVEAFWADGAHRIYAAADTIDAEPVLPGFAASVAELFAVPDDDEQEQ